jgi:hypothetical protein
MNICIYIHIYTYVDINIYKYIHILGAPVDREKGAKANTGNERHRRSH